MLLEQPIIGEELEAPLARLPPAPWQELDVVGIGVTYIVFVSSCTKDRVAERAPDAASGFTALVELQTPLSGEVPETAWAERPRPPDFISVLQVFVVQEIVLGVELQGAVTTRDLRSGVGQKFQILVSLVDVRHFLE